MAGLRQASQSPLQRSSGALVGRLQGRYRAPDLSPKKATKTKGYDPFWAKLPVLNPVLRWLQLKEKTGETLMLEQLTGLLTVLHGLDPMFVIAFMLCLTQLRKNRD